MVSSDTTSLLMQISDQMGAAVARASRYTVRVDARRRISGSGVIWDSGGSIVTADHVLEREEDIIVALNDGRELPAAVAGRDPSSDIALLKVAAEDLPAAERAPAIGVGNLVLAIGAASRRGITATSGIVSSLRGPGHGWRGGRLDELLWTDAVLYPGFSGGPMVDALGRLAGISTSYFGQGAGAGIPVATVERVVAALAAGGRVRRPFLGVTSQLVPLPPRLRPAGNQESALLIVAVEPESAADKAGLLLGDVLVAMDGAAINHADGLQRALAGHQPGDSVGVTVLRGGETRQIQVTLGERG